MRKLKLEITKPYRVPTVENRPLKYKSVTTSAKILLTDKPLYDGEIFYQRNPFWISCAGDTEFGVMKLARHAWLGSQVLEIKSN